MSNSSTESLAMAFKSEDGEIDDNAVETRQLANGTDKKQSADEVVQIDRALAEEFDAILAQNEPAEDVDENVRRMSGEVKEVLNSVGPNPLSPIRSPSPSIPSPEKKASSAKKPEKKASPTKKAKKTPAKSRR